MKLILIHKNRISIVTIINQSEVKEDVEQKFLKDLEENQNIVHKICRIYTQDRDAHNDLFQEITIQLWRAYPKFRGDSKFSTWMYRVALNTAITLYHKSKKRVSSVSIDKVDFKLASVEYNDEEEQQLKQMYKAIHQLNDVEKALVFLYLEDKPYVDISETLGISEVNARVKMNRVKIKLKKLLNP